MIQFLRGIVLIAMLIASGVAVAEPDQDSANFMMPACRAVVDLSSNGAPKGDPYIMGACAGTINGLSMMGVVFHLICLPNGVTSRQAIAVVVQYIDKRPARMHEDFKILATEALVEAWPCKK
jgi:Rap1a immunity proteins